MANPPQHPLLRLDAPKLGGRKTRKPGFSSSRKYDPGEQRDRPPGVELRRLAQAFAEGRDPLELRADPAGLAPERVLVFELTGDVQNFARAAASIPGLEFIGAEDLEGDEEDKSPTLYLMIPDSAAFRQMVSLWDRFQAGQQLPEGMTPWRDLFAQLRTLRPWGPADRVSADDLEVLSREHADARGMVRIELELVFRPLAAGVENDAVAILGATGGEIISRTRIDGAKYHAILADVPQAEFQRVLTRGREGLVAAESVMHIRPQSAVHIDVFEPQAIDSAEIPPVPQENPIVAVFDGVPLSGHPRLAGRLSVDDPFNLEPLAVGRRMHGTAMASAVLHGDIGG